MRNSVEMKVGIFAASALAILVFMIFTINPDLWSAGEVKSYYTLVDNAAGIVEKTHVQTNGVVVGRVAGIRLDQGKTRIDIEIRADVPIPVGSTIAIKEKGLLGDVFVDIMRVAANGMHIDAGGLIPHNTGYLGMSGLIAKAGEIGSDIKSITQSLSQVLGGDEGEQNIRDIVINFRDFFGNANDMIAENRKSIREMMANLRSTTATLDKLISDREAQLGQIVDNVQLASADIREVSRGLRDILDDENKAKIERIIASFDGTMQDVQATAGDFRLVAERIQKGEGTIGRLVNDDQAIEELQAAIADVREVLAPATRLRIDVDYHGEVRRDDMAQHYFRGYLRTRPDKFFLVGVTNIGERIRETTVSGIEPAESDGTETDPAPSALRERIRDRGPVLFDIQYGKRWGNLQLRFGLFESTGGFAGDVYAWHDQLKLTVEAYDWSNASPYRRMARVRAYLNVVFYKHLYGIIGVDDITRKDPLTGASDPEINYFIGAGLLFTDDDMKAVVGTASLAQ
ncbi:MAG: MlaD family protein [Zetaproteobacteria bacterium]|nr:MlaD family protein [Zetaproteobacteria bacterium]